MRISYLEEQEIKKMESVTDDDLEQMAQHYHATRRKFGRQAPEVKKAFRLYKRLAHRKEMLERQQNANTLPA